MALRPDSADSPAVVPPTRRSWMPVRSRIHSSLVSIIPARSSLVRTLGGSAVPQPVMTAPATPGGMAGSQLDLSQAMGWRAVTRSPLMAM